MSQYEDVFRREAPPSSEQGYFDKSAFIRVLIGLALAVSLFLVLHFREERLQHVELGAPASHYIIAEVPFTFPDNEATVVLRQESLRDLGKIYQLSVHQVNQARDRFDRMLSEDEGWREKLKSTTFEEMYLATDRLSEVLVRSRFTDARTLKRMEGVGAVTDYTLLYSPPALQEDNWLPTELWTDISKEAFGGLAIAPEAAHFIITYFAEQRWEMEEDVALTLRLREEVQEAVPVQKARVTAGTMIVGTGDIVTPRQIAMVQAMNQAIKARRNSFGAEALLGSALLALLFLFVTGVYLHMYHPGVFYSNRRLFLLATIIILTFILAKATEGLLLTSRAQLIEYVRYPLLVPFAGILLTSLLNARIATYVTFLLSIILSLSLAVGSSNFLILNLLTSLVAILSTRSLRQRKEIFVVCGKAWACAVAVIVAYHLYAGTFWSLSLLSDFLTTFVFMLLTAVIVVGLLPLLESLFRIITDIVIMEYMDPTHPLLRRLSIEAPGTYQHSIIVGNLAEAAALAVGANGLFCRAAPLYHDIGKIISPQYFTENQQEGVDPHLLLTPLESAQAIMAHVSEGVALARKYGVPEPFIDVIKEHHGTTLVYYFYHKQLQLEGGDASKVREADFRYAGPKPRTKESAIIMIADTVEAASRSLDDVSFEKVEPMIERLVRDKADDGQFDHCLLTFEELSLVKRELARALVAARHTRVAYPARMRLPPAGPGDDPAMSEGSPE